MRVMVSCALTVRVGPTSATTHAAARMTCRTAGRGIANDRRPCAENADNGWPRVTEIWRIVSTVVPLAPTWFRYVHTYSAFIASPGCTCNARLAGTMVATTHTPTMTATYATIRAVPSTVTAFFMMYRLYAVTMPPTTTPIAT